MRALPLLLLLLGGGGVSSQNDSTSLTISAKPGENKQTIITTATSTVQGTSPKSSTGNPPSASPASPTTAQGIRPESHTRSPPSGPAVSPSTTSATSPKNTPEKPPAPPAVSPTTARMSSPTNTPGKPPPSPAVSPSTAQGASPTNKLGHPPTTPVASSSVPRKVGPSAGSVPPVATTAATTSASQQQSSPSASPRNSLTTVATSPSTAQGSRPLDQPTSPAASTGVPAASPSPGLKDHKSSPKSVTQQPLSSPSSAVQRPASSTRAGSTNTSVAPSAGSVSPTTSKTSPSLPPGSIDKVSKPTTTLTPGAAQTSRGQGSMSPKPGIADQKPTSVQPSAPTSGHQTMSSRPGHRHPNDTFQNEIICEDQVQNSWPIISLKEAKTCAEWKTLTFNSSVFKTFCSTARCAYDPSRDKCTVTLASPEPRSRQWAVRVVVHLHLDPEKVFEELKEKRHELDELGITNVTFHDKQLEEEIKDRFSTPLIITIVTLAGSLLLVAAIYGCCHQRFSHKKDQHIHPDVPGFDDGHVALIFNQRLTEELQTMENGYHDNPTLEVMETSSEMQEKKVNLNGELGDSWIVPLDTLMKDDLEEEEDTHL